MAWQDVAPQEEEAEAEAAARGMVDEARAGVGSGQEVRVLVLVLVLVVDRVSDPALTGCAITCSGEGARAEATFARRS